MYFANHKIVLEVSARQKTLNARFIKRQKLNDKKNYKFLFKRFENVKTLDARINHY